MKTGFVGYGNMGGALLRSLLASGAIDQSNLVVSTRTKNKPDSLVNQYPGMKASSNIELAKKCSRIFICVRTGEAKGVIEEMSDCFVEGVHLVSICAGLEIKNLEKAFSGKITRIIPSITSEVGAGVSLVCHNNVVGEEDREYIERMLRTIGKVKVIREDQFEVGADLTSCAPAFIACIFREFASAGVRHSDFSMAEAREMVLSSLYGTAELLSGKQVGFDEIIQKVATRGGISAEGLKVLERELPVVFEELFKSTLGKHDTVKKQVAEQYV